MTNEQWLDINGYNGLYHISSLGRVKRVERTVMQWNHQLQKEIPVKYPKKYLKFDKIKGDYNRVTLSKDNKQERFIVHRKVAEYFVPNPDNKPHVHHKNHNSSDNRAVNLEWVTPTENERYKWENKNPRILAISPDGVETIWSTQMDCARGLGLDRNGIFRCLHNEIESYRGYHISFIRPLDK